MNSYRFLSLDPLDNKPSGVEHEADMSSMLRNMEIRSVYGEWSDGP